MFFIKLQKCPSAEHLLNTVILRKYCVDTNSVLHPAFLFQAFDTDHLYTRMHWCVVAISWKIDILKSLKCVQFKKTMEITFSLMTQLTQSYFLNLPTSMARGRIPVVKLKIFGF